MMDENPNDLKNPNLEKKLSKLKSELSDLVNHKNVTIQTIEELE